MSRGNWLLGLIIIVFGIILLLNNFGITDINLWPIIKTYWPLLLVLWGINVIWDNGGGSNYLSGGLLVTLGLLILGNNLELYVFDFSLLWKAFLPIILILVGINFIRGPKFQGKSNWAFMGGVDRTKTSWKLESGTHWAFMGGISLDLRKAEITEGEYFLNCTAIMGGIDIIVPENLSVICEGTAILGGLTLLGRDGGGIYSTVAAEQGSREAKTILRIYGRTIMGGIEVKAK